MRLLSQAVKLFRQHRRILELERTLEKRTSEFEQHLVTVRQERDGAMKALDQARKWADEIALLFERDIPSITKQTNWACELFDFRAAKVEGTDYFNPGLVEIDKVLWLVTRRARQLPGAGILGMNDLVAFELDGLLPKVGQIVKMRKQRSDQQFEDPRAFEHKGNIYLSCCTFTMFGKDKCSYGHQTLAVLDKKWRATKTHEPEFGHNVKDWLRNKGWEKNWLFFFHDDALMMVYLTRPHTVVEMNFDVPPARMKTWVTHDFSNLWVHGEPRGGTPPVRVGDEYWSFFHSSVPWIKNKRRYNMGAYAFEAKPPFAITRVTSLPLLSGSRRDPWNDGKPLVVFPCGALLRDGEWLVSLGVNDLACAWIKIPHDDLTELTQEIGGNSNLVSEVTGGAS